MPFIETEASVRYETINGQRVPVITPKTEVTLTNTETGQEYGSDEEARQDIDDPNTDTKEEDISRSVHIKVQSIPLGGKTNIF